jgi:hypothetical protein
VVGALDTESERWDGARQARAAQPPPCARNALDTGGHSHRWNEYAYVGDTPLEATDPLGLNGNGSTGCGVGQPADGPCPQGLINVGLVASVLYWDCITCSPGPPPGWVQANITGVPYCAANPLACMGGPIPQPSGDSGGGGGGGGGGLSAANTAPQTQVSCNTVLPNGKTVGDVVRGEIAALRSVASLGTGIDSLPRLELYADFFSIASSGGPIDFKVQFRGQANAALLGQEGNFAYYAIGSTFFPTTILDAGAGAYGISTAMFGSRHFRNLTGPWFSDTSAASVRSAGLASNGCPG